MSTVITISTQGEVTIEVTDEQGGCHPEPGHPTGAMGLQRLARILTERHDRTDGLIAALDAKVDAVKRLVRIPTRMTVHYGAPVQE